ncbi:ImmA/IrrE family metallo-endopeptidase [candidate division KSB1 bacterium]
MGISLLYKPLGEGIRGNSFRKNGIWHIVINKNDMTERRNFTIAHELFEIHLSGDNSLSLEEKHKLANEYAAEFLLPESDFRNPAHCLDLYELKEVFPEVSHEVIARRLISFIPAVITIFDNRIITSRFASRGINYPLSVSGEEISLMEECYKSESKIDSCQDTYKICGYYLEEMNGIKRVILILELDELIIEGF